MKWQKSHQPSQLLISNSELQRILGLQLQLRGEFAHLDAGKKQSALSRGVRNLCETQSNVWIEIAAVIHPVCISTQGKPAWISESTHAFRGLAEKTAPASLPPSLPTSLPKSTMAKALDSFYSIVQLPCL